MGDVIDIKSRKKEKNNDEAKGESEETTDFEAIAKRNAENEKRLKKERNKHNKATLRQYRISTPNKKKDD